MLAEKPFGENKDFCATEHEAAQETDDHSKSAKGPKGTG